MTGSYRVVWSEGMFILPQHFQQSDRYFEQLIRNSTQPLRSFAWGVSFVEIDQAALAIGQFAIIRASGLMEDGTPFLITPEALPPSLQLPPTTRDCIVYLALPRLVQGVVDFAPKGDETPYARYQVSDTDVRDCTSMSSETTAVQVGVPQFRFVLATDPRPDLVCLGLARISEVRADRQVVLDPRYIPPCLSVGTAPPLARFLTELQGLLHQRAESLAGRLSETGGNAAPQSNDFLLLLTVNRWEPLISHLSGQQTIHPEDLYTTLLQLAGELAAFIRKSRRPPPFPIYRHDDLHATYLPLIEELRTALTTMISRTAEKLELEYHEGVWYAPVKDRTLLSKTAFILAVRASVRGETLRTEFPGQTKIGPAEKISELINSSARGIGLEVLPTAPRQLPYHAGTIYLELDRQGELWRKLERSPGIAIHVSGEFPDLDMELWTIREVAL
ncbi:MULTISPECIES: type VI secretion system baseplate subunit TssK [unclassified Azospirillum]|uniref:type VI secretion system baseplate subunit TssK n=1 Tax=unclassified Azospirillum TaxID=2630922 RepID=UPI000B64FF7B|nr:MULTISPECIES: type VI secretion system baseplate subunit TssK [unclassified Azospirillum]SNS92255.1 type VI secretion system protein ImpJ [Azospirillum sp. RU38E]SNT09214.1 type VI secretion system protein ImpJ [Azospirillum sp. RU37A]